MNDERGEASLAAKLVGFGILAGAIVLALFFGFSVKRPPLKIQTETFVIFAGIYIVTAGVERAMELLIAPWMSGADQRPNRGVVVGAFATLAGVAASGTLGLYFINSISQGGFGAGRDNIARTADVLITGLAIGGGTKPLHDLITRVQKGKEKEESAAAEAKAKAEVETAQAELTLAQLKAVPASQARRSRKPR